jgi:acetylornithine deacetylase/succinyl-diaminopimelate desuccinylase-like protein
MRSLIRYPVALLALVALPVSAQPRRSAPIDWKSLGDETVRTLSEYLKIDTSNPPGNELETARFLARILEREGIEATIFDTTSIGSGRANLYARLKGSGTKKAIALVHHMDVVPADRRYWSVDPFSGAIKDGYVWGRGALDMRGTGIVQLMAMIAIKRSGLPLTRDIVFIANADEELGSLGAKVFVSSHADLLREVEYVLTEGSGNPVRDGVLTYFGVGVSEKRTFWHRLTVKGTPGHGSRPTKTNPVPRLIAALDRLATHETPIHVTAGVENHFKKIARLYSGEQRAWLADIRSAVDDPRGREWVLSDPDRNAQLRNTISLTVLTGSNKTNVIPAEASAEVDIRLLPDQDPATILAELKAVVNDSAVEWSPLATPQAPLESPIDTELFRAIEKASMEREPKAFITTPMSTGGTDRPHYRSLGIITYGWSPFLVDVEDSRRGVHGNDERVSVENIGFGVRYLFDVLRYAQ